METHCYLCNMSQHLAVILIVTMLFMIMKGELYMTLIKNKSKFYSLKPILSKRAQYNIIVGERSNGKTYACLKYAIEQYIKTKRESAILRRFREDFIGRRGATMFDALVSNGEIAKITKNEWTDVYYYSSRWYLCKYENGERIKDENCFCYGFALSSAEHDKSSSYPNIDTIIFDEFITRTMYLTDEFTIFQNVISTIIRQRENVKIFMLGNTVNKYGCPYVAEMGLKHFKNMNQGDIDVYRYGDTQLTVAVEYCKPNSDGKPNNYYFAFDNPKLSMITTGTWELDIYPHIPEKYKPKHVLLHFYVNYSGEWLHGEIVQLDNKSFIYMHPKTTPLSEYDRTHVIIFSPEFSPLPNWHRRITEPHNKVTKKIAQYLYEDRVFYSSNDVGEIMRNYLLFCTKSDI